MREPDHQAVRRALLAEIEAHRREHPHILVYLIARAIHEARLGASATLQDLDDAALRALVTTVRAGVANGGLL